MKKHFSFAIVLTLLSLGAAGQIKHGVRNATYYSKDNINFFPDSIRVEFPEAQAFVVFELKNYSASRVVIDNFNTLLKDLIFYIKKTSTDKDFAVTPHQARVSGQGDEKEIEVVATKTTNTKLSIKNNQVTELLPPGWEIIIGSSEGRVYVYGKNLESMEKITTIDQSIVTAKINSQIPFSIGRKSVKARFILRNGVVENADIQLKHPGDIITGAPAVGFGFVDNTFYPVLTPFAVSLIFRDRYGRKNHMVKLSSDYMLFTRTRLDGKTTVGTNLATSLSYSKNFSRNTENPLWVGLGVGAVSNNLYGTVYDTHFRGSTMRIFASFDVRSNFSIVPELFLTDNTTNAIYGLRLNFTLP